MIQNIDITPSSGNVFADLDLPNPDEMLVKAELARRISYAITARDITESEAADLLGIDQPQLCALLRGRLTDFSLERMFRFLNLLGSDVEIRVRTKSNNDARTIVVG